MKKKIGALLICPLVLTMIATVTFSGHEHCDRCIDTDDGYAACQGGYPSGWDNCVPHTNGFYCVLHVLCTSHADGKEFE